MIIRFMGTSSTAELMALFRALETARPPGERLFEDPFAVDFLRPSLRRVARAAKVAALRAGICRVIDRLAPGARPAGIARTRLIDDALGEAIADGAEQVLILGVGFDVRSYRLPCLAGRAVFELDRPEMLARRRRTLSAARPFGSIVSVPVDFDREGLPDAMRRTGFDAGRRTFFLLEGVTNYLGEREAEALFHFVGAAAPGSRLLFTYVLRKALESPEAFEGTRFLGWALRRFGEPWTFGLDPSGLREWLKRVGLELLVDEGSTEVRERYLGAGGRTLRGYEFYRAALARVV